MTSWIMKIGVVASSSLGVASATQITESHFAQPILAAGLGGVISFILVKHLILQNTKCHDEIKRLNRIIYNLSSKEKGKAEAEAEEKMD